MSFHMEENSGQEYFQNAMDPTMYPTLSGQPLYYDDSSNILYHARSDNEDLDRILDNSPQHPFAEAHSNQGQMQTFNGFMAPPVPTDYQNQQGHSGYEPHFAGAVNYQNQQGHSGFGPPFGEVVNSQNEHIDSGAETAAMRPSYPHNYAPSESSAQSSQKRRVSSSGESNGEFPEESQPAPKKRRKSSKSKKTRSEPEPEAKREKFLERNRVAARKCRENKKEMNQVLQRNYEGLERRTQELHLELEMSKQELDNVKALLYAHSHAGCNDPEVANWVQTEGRKAFNRASTPQAPPISMQRTDSYDKFKVKYRRMMGGDGMQSEPMSRKNSSQSRMGETMSRQESTNSQGGATKMSPQFSSQSSKIETPIDSGISNMGSPNKIKAEARSPFKDEGYSGQPMMQNQRLPRGVVGGLRGMDDPEEYLARPEYIFDCPDPSRCM